MSRVTSQALADAIEIIRAMDLAQKKRLADELFHTQPNMFGSALVLQRMGVAPAKIEVALDLLFVCFQSMKQSGLLWPLITEADLDKQLGRYVATVRFGEDLSRAQSDRAMMQYIKSHPEKPLLTYVTDELNKWLASVIPEATDNYVMLASMNFVNCIAFTPIPAPTKRA
jgi:hypothetical protein